MEKINGFNRNLHPFQIISYVFFLSLLISYFFILFPLSSDTCKVVGCILEVVTGAFVVVSGYLATSIDPSDPFLKSARKARFTKTQFEAPIQDFYCSNDHCHVLETSKHCRRCNRCTERFDHHCKWINNDVGKANYKVFLVMITSVMLFLAVYLVLGIILTIQFAKDSELINQNIYLFPNEGSKILVGMIILWFYMVLSGLFFILDTNLVLFHIFLITKGLTTYQYITAVEERKENQRDLEFAMKMLGENKKTCLDFILCLKRKKSSQDPNLTVHENIQKGHEHELENLKDYDKKKISSLLEKEPSKGDTKAALENTQHEDNLNCSVREKIALQDDNMLSIDRVERKNSDPNSRGTTEGRVESFKEELEKNHEGHIGHNIQPIIINIQPEKSKTRSKRVKEERNIPELKQEIQRIKTGNNKGSRVLTESKYEEKSREDDYRDQNDRSSRIKTKEANEYNFTQIKVDADSFEIDNENNVKQEISSDRDKQTFSIKQ